MKYPQIQETYTTRHVTDTFRGYNHKLKIADGEFFDMKNLTSKDYPMLATRPYRSTVTVLSKPQGILAKDRLCYVDDGKLYYGGEPTPVDHLTPGEKQLVSMGAYVCIFPDKAYFNTEDQTDYGSMEAMFASSGTTKYQITTLTGDPYENYTVSPTAPENPQNLQYWFDTSSNSLKQYSASQETWITIATVYTRIRFQSRGLIPQIFRVYDGVHISGTAYPEELDGDKVIYGLGGSDDEDDYIIVIGLIEASLESETEITITRNVPDMDFVVEAQNRLWGCKYGATEEYGNLNEIYACALGDFRNWRQYQGLSTDSWTASVGSDGPWTGAVNFLGYPTFFKEDRIHRVTVSSIGAHSIQETVARGVQQGSHKSLTVVNELLLYKSRTDVVAYQGGFPESVSEALGDVRYYDAVGGAYGKKYYISMRDENSKWSMFAWDADTGLWMKEDELHSAGIAVLDDSLYCIDAETNRLLDLNGADGALEGKFDFMAQSGLMYYELPDKKYISRLDIRLASEKGTDIRVYMQYDSDGLWRDSGKMHFKGTNTITFPIRPRRCDHLELRLVGTGPIKVFSFARILEQGSDV